MKHKNVDYKKRYVEVGQPAAVYPHKHRGEPFVGIVEKITKNKFGRVSYVVKGMTVFAEELFPSENQQKMKLPYFRPTKQR